MSSAPVATPQQQQPIPTITIPPFSDVFPFINLHTTLTQNHLPLPSSLPTSSLSGSTFLHFLRTTYTPQIKSHLTPLLSSPTTTPSDATIRTKLPTNPYVSLHGKLTLTTPRILSEIFSLADDLKLSEIHATALYAAASDTSQMKHVLKMGALDDDTSVPALARRLFFHERDCALESLLSLIRERLIVSSASDASTGETSTLAIIVGTDELLSSGLISQLITLVRELTIICNTGTTTPSPSTLVSPSSSNTPKESDAEGTYRRFAFRQRQKAMECLFYLLRDAQVTMEEICAMIDLAKDLSDGLDDVSVLKMQQQQRRTMGGVSMASPFDLMRKTADATTKMMTDEEMEKDLLTSLYQHGTPQLLRLTNTLLLAIISALDPNGSFYDRSTHTPSPYNTLLPPPSSPHPIPPSITNLHSRLTSDSWLRRDVHSLLASAYALLLAPHCRANTPTALPFNVPSTHRTLLELLPDNHSCSYLITHLLPSLPPSDDHFLIATAEFYAQYLGELASCGIIPLSRHLLAKDEEEEREIHRLNEDQRRRYGFEPLDVPPEDERRRPDCMDDVLRVVVEICTRCPRAALAFWGDGTTFDKLVVVMEGVVREDGSLLPDYVNYLSCLALREDEEAMGYMNGFLMGEENKVNWNFVLTAVRWYAEELRRGSGGGVDRTTATTAITTRDASNESYYYGVGDWSGENNSYSESSSDSLHPKSPTSIPSRKVLGESNAWALKGMLALIQRVVHSNDDARTFVGGLRWGANDSLMISSPPDDDALTVLFSLLGTTITSDLKGMTFDAIAALIKDRPEWALKTWDILEHSQVIPTLLLSQYPTAADVGGASAHAGGGERYGILFEMERIESMEKTYPATEGLLNLLATLIETSGCLTTVGLGLRRPGINPYVEYVTTFLLPRILPQDGKTESILPFGSTADRHRLLAKALRVLDAVMRRYAIPNPQEGCVDGVRRHRERVASEARALGLVITNGGTITNEELQSYIDDYTESNGPDQTPRPKTPPFVLLSDVTSGGPLLKHVLQTLTIDSSSPDTLPTLNDKSHLQSCANALLPTTPPLPLHPCAWDNAHLPPHDAISWRMQSLSLALSLLSLAAAFNPSFITLVNDNPQTLTITPTLRFVIGRSGGIDTTNVTPSRLGRLLMASGGSPCFEVEPMVALGRWVACEEDMGRMALGLVRYVERSGGKNVMAVLSGREEGGEGRLVESFARRLFGGGEGGRVVLDVILEGVDGGEVGRAMLTAKGRNCVDVALELVGRESFWETSEGRVVSKTYELIRKCYRDETLRSVMVKKLPSDFWMSQIERYLPLHFSHRRLTIDDTHALAWLLKSLAEEIYHSQRKSSRRKLIHTLLSPPTNSLSSSRIEQSLVAIDLHYPPKATLSSPPSRYRSMIQKSSQMLTDGPIDICSRYHIIDTSSLDSTQHAEFLTWADQWNDYVRWSCSVTHVASSFDTLLGSILADNNDESSLLDNNPSILDGIVTTLLEKIERGGEAGSILPLAHAVLRTVSRLGSESLPRVCHLLARVMTTGGGGGGDSNDEDERVAVLGAALASGLKRMTEGSSSQEGDGGGDDSSFSSWRIGGRIPPPNVAYASAAIRLCHLSSLPTNTSSSSSVGPSPRSIAIILTARSALSSLLSTLGSSLISSLFSGDNEGQSRLSRLVSRLPTGDATIGYLLQRVAGYPEGRMALIRAGASAAMAVGGGRDDDMMMEDDEMMTGYGTTIEVSPPEAFAGHVQLFNVLLSGSKHQKNDGRIERDAMRFARRYTVVGQQLLRSYPSNGDLTEGYLTLLSVAATVELGGGGGWDILRKCVSDLTFHLACHPLEQGSLPRLPDVLERIERESLNRKRVVVKEEKSWWNGIPETAWDGRRMPDVMDGGRWDDDVLEFALRGSKCLEAGLSFLKRVGYQGDVDGIVIAKSLCRCGDVARMVHYRLENTTLANNEREALSTFGSMMGRCTEMLLVLAAMHLRHLKNVRDHGTNSRVTTGRKHYESITRSLREFKEVMMVVLNHVQIEKMGIACVTPQGKNDIDFGKQIARSVRENLQEIASPVEITR